MQRPYLEKFGNSWKTEIMFPYVMIITQCEEFKK